METFLRLVVIAIGGAAGTLARYGTGTLLRPLMERSPFPYATLAVNLLGCFVMGVLRTSAVAHWPWRWVLALAAKVTPARMRT